MHLHSFLTLAAPAEALFKEKGSRFLAFAWPVNREDEVREHLRLLRKKYFDASHHCYAWAIGTRMETTRVSDDGEPAHSAGDPIMGQIRAKKLTNVLVVVVRYFGGTKLGVGGLVSAYRTAAEGVLSLGSIISKDLTQSFTVVYPYASTPEVMRLIRDFELIILHEQFSENCKMHLEVKVKNREALLGKLNLLTALGKKIVHDLPPEP